MHFLVVRILMPGIPSEFVHLFTCFLPIGTFPSENCLFMSFICFLLSFYIPGVHSWSALDSVVIIS